MLENLAGVAVPHRIIKSDVALPIPDIPMLHPQVISQEAQYITDITGTFVRDISGVDGGFDQRPKVPVLGTFPLLARPNLPSFGFVVEFPNLPVIFS